MARAEKLCYTVSEKRRCVGLPLKIIRNDITKVEADAIVNPANPLPCIGAGTDAAIHAAAGPALLEARRAIGSIAVGDCAATPAFGLPAKYVLHAVSPGWAGGQAGEAELLRKTYDAALLLAGRLHCESVAFPLLAAGSYGFPHAVALSVAIQAFTDFLLEHDITICLVLFNAKAYGLAGSLFDDLKSYIDDNYVDAQSRKESRFGRFQRRAERVPFLGNAAPAAARADEARDAAPDAGLAREAEACDFCAPSMASAAAVSGLKDYIAQSESTFSEHLRDLLTERSGKDSEVYKRAEVSKQLFSKILSNRDYQPTKSTAIQLAVGLQLDLEQTQKLLDKAGFSLTRSSRADLVVEYCIRHKIYSVTFINEALDDCGLPLLKTGLKS